MMYVKVCASSPIKSLIPRTVWKAGITDISLPVKLAIKKVQLFF
jgi:hypothetical protein